MSNIFAFPSHGSMGEVVEQGMSLRDYFIAHAPAEPQPWFRPVICDKPLPKFTDESAKETGPYFTAMREAEKHFNTHDEYIVIANALELDIWDMDYKRLRYTQWPVAWADEMLKARES